MIINFNTISLAYRCSVLSSANENEIKVEREKNRSLRLVRREQQREKQIAELRGKVSLLFPSQPVSDCHSTVLFCLKLIIINKSLAHTHCTYTRSECIGKKATNLLKHNKYYYLLTRFSIGLISIS